MRNDVQKSVPRNGTKGGGGGGNNGFFSLRAISGYLRIVSSGASTVASTVRSASVSVATSIAAAEDGAARDQVHWAGFDKLECEADVLRQVLLLGYRSGFQVWDLEEADNVRQLVSRHEGPVSFMQMLKKPIASKRSEDKFADVRPLLAIAGDGSFSGGSNTYDGLAPPGSGNFGSCQEQVNGNFVPTVIQFYSLRTHDFVNVLKFRSAVYTVRCSPRVVAVSQAGQIHCFDAATLEREYIILTYPIVSGCLGSGGIGYGPLAVGPRWLAYSGSPVMISNTGRVSPQHLTPATNMSTSPSNGSLVAHYAKESSKQLAVGIVTLGDIGYKKLSKYCSELLPDGNTIKQGSPSLKVNGTINGHLTDAENAGMVIVRDLVSKSVIVQFGAHKSPISALCFDPSGTLLVTASVHGHNINVFRVTPSFHGGSLGSDASGSYTHLYRLQRGLTNAVIQDISFSDDSQRIMISSSRGTSHLFAISPSGDSGLDLSSRTAIHWPPSSSMSKFSQQTLNTPALPVTLSVVSRIRNGSNGWKGAVTGAAAAATGRVNPLSGAIASAFHNCNDRSVYPDVSSLGTKYHLLVFSPSGCVIQYVLRHSTGADSGIDLSGLSTIPHDSGQDTDTRSIVEPLQKWDVCHEKNRRDRGDNIDIYGEHGSGHNTRIYTKGLRKGTSVHPTDSGVDTKPKLSAEEKYHLYISEVELHTHSAWVPLWAKSEIYFQTMMDANTNIDNGSASGGEIEIEKIPTRTVEARSKDLIPVFDYLQMPRFQQARASGIQNESSVQQKPGLLEDDLLLCRSNCSSLDCMSEGAAMDEIPNAINENGWAGLQSPKPPVEGFVNNNNSLNVNTQLEFVDNREGQTLDAQLETVNNRESLKMENHFEGDDNEID